MTYWEKRKIEAVERVEKMARQRIPEMMEGFEEAKREINRLVEAFYGRYAKNNGLTLEEAGQALTRSELFSFRDRLKDFEQLAKNSIGSYSLELENLSVKARVTRLQALRFDIDTQLQRLYQQQKKQVESAAKAAYRERYTRAQYDLSQYTGKLFGFAKTPESRVKKVLEEPVMGADISERLWRQDLDAGFKIRQTLSRMFLEGRPPQDFAEELQKIIGAVRVDRAGNVTGTGKKYEAYRLLYNESSYLAAQADLDAYRDDGLDYYEIIATLDGKTSEICRSLDGCIFSATKGGEVPKQYVKSGDEYRRRAYAADRVTAGVNFPPFHINCRTTTAPYLPSREGFKAVRAARDPETGKTIEVPAEMTYAEWYEKYVKNDQLKSFIDNAKIGLSEKEEWAINEYISSGSYKINAPLRDGSPLSDDQKNMVKFLDAALEKIPVYEGTVYRSLDSSMIPNLEKFWLEHKVGAKISYSAYTSAGTEIYDSSMSIQMIIYGKHGHDLRKYNPGEMEILFPRDAEFLVTKIVGNTIYMEEI